jgi:hypothetical protein
MALAEPSDVQPCVGLVPGDVVRVGSWFATDRAGSPPDDAVSQRRSDRPAGLPSQFDLSGAHEASVTPAASDMSQVAYR